MHGFSIALPPLVLMRIMVGGVWLYEGLWCKLLGRARAQAEVVAAVPRFGPRFGVLFLKTLGFMEVAIAVWSFSGMHAGSCAIFQAALLIVLNANGLLWARHVIHEPLGMVVKNAAFLTLVWTWAAISGGRL